MGMASHTVSRRERIAQRKRRDKARRIIAGAAIGSGILLVILAGRMLNSNPQLGSQAFNYDQEDINYDKPITAVHEMGAGPAIPFLPMGGPQPDLVINEQYFDFGRLGPKEVVEKEFVIANTGAAPLTISRAYTTCGCTTAEFTSAVVPPGEVSIVTLIFDAGFHDVRGQTVRRGVILENNDPQNSTAEIWIQASIRNTP